MDEELAAAIIAEPSKNDVDTNNFRIGTVTSLSPLTVALQGGEVVTPGWIGPTFAVGDPVMLARQSSTWAVLGHTGSGAAAAGVAEPFCWGDRVAFQAMGAGVFTNMPLDTLRYDNNGMLDLVNGRMRINITGWWHVEGVVSWVANNTAGYRGTLVELSTDNGASWTVIALDIVGNAVLSIGTAIGTSKIVSLSAGNLIRLSGFQNVAINASGWLQAYLCRRG